MAVVNEREQGAFFPAGEGQILIVESVEVVGESAVPDTPITFFLSLISCNINFIYNKYIKFTHLYNEGM